jgi:DMSO/TMAO reductase YedYZ heme-binding membrane subunit
MALASVGPSALWYLTRSSGAIALLLLTVSVALGVVNVGRVQATGWPRFVLEGVHRNVSLLALAFLAVHIVTAVLDPFAAIRVIDALIPFTGSYRPIWLGLGAFASDLLIAVALTSLVRRRLGHGAWRATHWLAYLCWPVAIVHAAGTGSDIKQTWMLALTAVCMLTVIVAVCVRLRIGWPNHRGLRGGALMTSLALPTAFLIWLPSGPLGSQWARRAGTPLNDLASARATVPAPATHATRPASDGAASVTAFSAAVSGSATQTRTARGLVEVQIALTIANGQLAVAAVSLYGDPVASGGVEMTSSTVSIGSATEPALFSGAVTSLTGTDIDARVSAADGRTLDLAIDLRINAATGAATGTVRATPR